VLHIVRTLNLVRLGNKHKLKYIKILKTKKSTRILQILLKYNYILGWGVVQQKNHQHYLVYISKNTAILHVLATSTKKLYIKYKYLQLLKQYFSSTTIFISTNCGIISVADACTKKVGGFLLFRFV
jgi:ribosomal protein S8